MGPIIGGFYVAIGIIGFFVTGFGNFLANTPATAGVRAPAASI